MTRASRFTAACAAGAVLALGAACTEPWAAGVTPPPSTEDVGRFFATYLEEAQELGLAGPEQLAALEKAVTDDGMTFEELSELTRLTYDCFTEAGIEYHEEDPAELGIGYHLPSYTWGAEMPGWTLEEVQAMGDACIDRYSYWASMAYQDTRVVGEAGDARLRRDLPRVVECLRDNGVEVAQDATLDEIRQEIEDLAFAAEPVVCHDGWR